MFSAILNHAKTIVAAIVLFAAAQSAQAQQKAAFVLANPTLDPIVYEIKWGEAGEWQRFTVPSGKEYRHSWTPDASGFVPTPYVRYDYIFNDGLTTYREYRLDFNMVFDPAHGRLYDFRVNSGRNELDLLAVGR